MSVNGRVVKVAVIEVPEEPRQYLLSFNSSSAFDNDAVGFILVVAEKAVYQVTEELVKPAVRARTVVILAHRDSDDYLRYCFRLDCLGLRVPLLLWVERKDGELLEGDLKRFEWCPLCFANKDAMLLAVFLRNLDTLDKRLQEAAFKISRDARSWPQDKSIGDLKGRVLYLARRHNSDVVKRLAEEKVKQWKEDKGIDAEVNISVPDEFGSVEAVRGLPGLLAKLDAKLDQIRRQINYGPSTKGTDSPLLLRPRLQKKVGQRPMVIDVRWNTKGEIWEVEVCKGKKRQKLA